MATKGQWHDFAQAIHDLRAAKVEACNAAAEVIAKGSRFFFPEDVDWVFDGRKINDTIRPLIRLPNDFTSVLWSHKYRSGKDQVITLAIPDPNTDGGMIINNVIKFKTGWGLISTSIFFHLTEKGQLALRGGQLQDGAPRLDQDEILKENAISSVSTVINLCGMLGTKVATPEKISPPQMARLRSNLTLPSYHILSVGGEKWDGNHEASGLGSGVRSHFRRGHIRVLGEGNYTWVRHTIVHGSRPGFIDKDYRVDMAEQSSTVA